MRRNTWGGVRCICSKSVPVHFLSRCLQHVHTRRLSRCLFTHTHTGCVPRNVNTLVKGKVNAALYDYLYGWLWRYSHIPHDLNVNERMRKLGHLAGQKYKVSRKRLVAPRPVKCSDEPTIRSEIQNGCEGRRYGNERGRTSCRSSTAGRDVTRGIRRF